MDCPSEHFIEISSVFYGRDGDLLCTEDPIGVIDEVCSQEDALNVVSNMCNSKQSCEISVSSVILGEPCINVYKYLTVRFQCRRKSEDQTSFFLFKKNPIPSNKDIFV